ncbi:MAG: universal stress protein [Bacteroidia bacterium]|nr:universal stress protein [Bacteroidia bacterium]
MGKLIAGIDYSPASLCALEALLLLQKALKNSIALYHAYQLPKGLPFLSAHVIEDMEMEAERTAIQRLRHFLRESLPDRAAQRIQIIAQRDFLTEGLSRYLQTGRFSLLALGARGEAETESEPIGFHARHFIQHSPIPVLITFPHTTVTWKRLLVAYEPNFRSPGGQRFLRQLTRKLNLPVAGLPLLRPNPNLDRVHNQIRRITRATDYQRVVWDGAHLVRLLLQAARSYEADVIAYFSEPQGILQGMRSMMETELDGQPAWMFFPGFSPVE